ncbi:hypothetical protein GOZ83_19720 [Agrobacterium vitis]|uniref:phage capsid protein n=1 Tax=Agrobacterium vitis TaxID=373 RepID=UPI0012E7B46B|nr:phage capsid protein [Agrobacterium vitis]MVA47287.1 hypothetical protein [Agrobacterium vitis]NTA34323.1 hypothetical protein [Agrobacterium vitis]
MTYVISKEQYVSEWVVAFQRGETILKSRVTKQVMSDGKSAYFPIQGAAGRMTRRGSDGRIPSRQRTDSLVKVDLEEKHSKEERTGFDIFTCPAPLRTAMQNAGAETAAREIDYTIIETLQTATNEYNANAVTLTYGTTTTFMAKLFQNDVMTGNEITCLWTPMAWAKLMTFDQFINADYVDMKMLNGISIDKPKFWNGALHMQHTGLPGVGTSKATNLIFAKPAIGHSIAEGDVKVAAGYNEEDDYSFSRHTIFDGAVILQQAGVIKLYTDDTAAIT